MGNGNTNDQSGNEADQGHKYAVSVYFAGFQPFGVSVENG